MFLRREKCPLPFPMPTTPCQMIHSLPFLSCELSVTVRQNLNEKKSCCDNEGIMKTGYINNENSRNKMNIDTEKNIDKRMHELIMVKQN